MPSHLLVIFKISTLYNAHFKLKSIEHFKFNNISLCFFIIRIIKSCNKNKEHHFILQGVLLKVNIDFFTVKIKLPYLKMPRTAFLNYSVINDVVYIYIVLI